MIDNIQIRVENVSNQDFMKLAKKLGINILIDSDKIKFDSANLRFAYYPNIKKLIISNSWHKFYNSEFAEIKISTNHNDFTIENFYTVAHYLSEFVLERTFDELFISSRFEFGLNIDTDNYKPFDILEKYQTIASTHINDFFTIAPIKGKPIQRNCHFSDWYAKGYDKGLQANLINTNILRFEIVVTELRKLRHVLNIEKICVADIITVESWNKMFNFLMTTYDSIRKIPAINNMPISIEEINSIYSYCNKLKRSDIKNSTTRYYFEHLNKGFKNIYDKHNDNPNNYHNIIRQKMFNTYQRLINQNLSNFGIYNNT